MAVVFDTQSGKNIFMDNYKKYKEEVNINDIYYNDITRYYTIDTVLRHHSRDRGDLIKQNPLAIYKNHLYALIFEDYIYTFKGTDKYRIDIKLDESFITNEYHKRMIIIELNWIMVYTDNKIIEIKDDVRTEYEVPECKHFIYFHKEQKPKSLRYCWITYDNEFYISHNLYNPNDIGPLYNMSIKKCNVSIKKCNVGKFYRCGGYVLVTNENKIFWFDMEYEIDEIIDNSIFVIKGKYYYRIPSNSHWDIIDGRYFNCSLKLLPEKFSPFLVQPKQVKSARNI